MGQKLFKSTTTFAGMTLLSRVLGFWREMILAQVFGAGGIFDAFVIAFRIPNFLRTLFAEGAFSQAFVPVLAGYREQKTPQQIQHFVNSIAGNLGLCLLIVVIIAEVGAPLIVLGFAPGFAKDPARFHLTQQLLYLTFPYIFFISLAAFGSAILNTFGRFGISAFTPVILNVVLIFSAWYVAPKMHEPIMALAWGVMFAGVFQLVAQIPYLKKVGLIPRPIVCWKDPGVRRVMKLMVPAIFGSSVAQISLLIDNLFASFLPAGSVSWLYYSDRLIYLPVGVVGVAIGTVVLPHLARHFTKASEQAFSYTVDWGLRCVLVSGMPACIGLLTISGPILATLLRHGEFSNTDVIMTTRSLVAFSVGLPAVMAGKVLASAFYSRQDIKTPVRIAVYVLIIGTILNFVFIGPLAHAGLALVTSLTNILDSAWLLYLLHRYKFYRPRNQWLAFLIRISFASALMAAVLWFMSGSTQTWLKHDTWKNSIDLMELITAGGLTYFASLWISGMRLNDFRAPTE